MSTSMSTPTPLISSTSPPLVLPSALTDVAGGMQEAQMASLLSNWKLTPATMMAHLDPSWIPAKWLQYLSLKIAQCIIRGNNGLLISAPPRHGKSRLSTIATPLWVLENFPSKQVVVATYGEELSTDFSRDIRDFIQNNPNELSVRLRSDTQRVTNFMTTMGGGLKAVGLKGTITGRGANVLVIDDYIKNDKEAMSPGYMDDLWNWYLTTARTRLEPGAVIIILATRWVANDLHGRIMKMQQRTGRYFYEYISLPAIAVEGKEDPIHRSPGQVLFPERYDTDSIHALRDELGSRWFGAMFQQNPEEGDNDLCNPAWFKGITRSQFDTKLAEAEAAGYTIKWVRDWDMASTKEAGDFTTGARCAYIKETGEFFIESMRRGQYSAARAEEEFKACVKIDYDEHPDLIIGMEQEPGSSGSYSIRHFQGIARKIVSGSKVYEHRATTSKLLNAQPLLAAAEAGKVFVVQEIIPDSENRRPWTEAFYSEIELFPESDHDDQMDSTAGAYKLATGKTSLTAAIGRSMDVMAAKTRVKGIQTGQIPEDSGVKRRSSVTFGRKRY